jgi:uncharacterized protein YrrD
MQSLRYLLGDGAYSSQTQKRSGIIKQAIIDPEMGKIIALFLDTFVAKPYLSLKDVLDYDPDKIIFSKEEDLLDEEDLPRIKQIKEKRIRVLNARVFTESDQYLGKISDLIFDEHSGDILRYYVSRPFFASPLKAYLILEKSDIKKIEKRGVIVRNLEKRERAHALAS